MKSYTEVEIDGLTYWYRITGNSHGWTMIVQLPSTPQCPIQSEVRYPFWERPIDMVERPAYYEAMARKAVDYLNHKVKA